MTFEQKIRELLSEYGLWPDKHIDAVIERCKTSEALKSMDRWSDTIDNYPESMLTVIWLSVRYVTVKYIDEVIPQAWYRGMFVDNSV